MSRAKRKTVAQIVNLLYRRLLIGGALACPTFCGFPIRDTADYQSALQLK